MQNISHAVMSQRHEPPDSPDNFPTPPWATRALLTHVIIHSAYGETCLEPACGAGHMSRVLEEYFPSVHSSDAFDSSCGTLRDFLKSPYPPGSYDWVITNPPFKHAEEFVLEGLQVARIGVAMLCRTVFLESSGRYNNLFSTQPPSVFAQFVERVPMVKGRVDPKASTATSYAWFVWFKGHSHSRLAWIPPCRKSLERPEDYPGPPATF